MYSTDQPLPMLTLALDVKVKLAAVTEYAIEIYDTASCH
jgi:hypothetical protein